MSTNPLSSLTPEQYLAIERRAPHKSEYYLGEMFAMAGATRQHNALSLRLGARLSDQLEERDCEVYVNDMRVQVASTGLFTYPDVVAVCEIPQFIDSEVDTLANPAFLCEVLSPSTEAYDRGRKFEHYRNIESLREYLLLSQDRMQADLFTRQPDGRWVLASASRPEDILELRSIGCSIRMGDLYRKVKLPAAVPVNEADPAGAATGTARR